MLALLVTMLLFFFFNDTATTEIYTLSLHDALPIYRSSRRLRHVLSCRQQSNWWGCRHESLQRRSRLLVTILRAADATMQTKYFLREADECLLTSKQRSEEHTSELQSQSNLVCRLLL